MRTAEQTPTEKTQLQSAVEDCEMLLKAPELGSKWTLSKIFFFFLKPSSKIVHTKVKLSSFKRQYVLEKYNHSHLLLMIRKEKKGMLFKYIVIQWQKICYHGNKM